MPTLLDDFHHVHWQLLQQRRGLADPLPAKRLVRIGLAELALGAALIDRLRALCWQTVVDVLAAGGSLTECAAAMGLAEEPLETVSARLTAWATDQFEHGLLPEDDHQRILELAAAAGADTQMERSEHPQ